METRAKLQGGKYILNGSKNWITNAPIADVFIIWAKDDEGDIRGFILEKDFPGLSTQYIDGKSTLMASATGMVCCHTRVGLWLHVHRSNRHILMS